MIKHFFEKTWGLFISISPFYNLEPKFHSSDKARSKTDLVNDIYQKRVLLHKLNKRAEFSLISLFVMVFIFAGSIISYKVINEENGIFLKHIESFQDRSNYSGELGKLGHVEYAEVNKALSLIEDGNYQNAAAVLSNSNNDEANWLKALCLVKLGMDGDAQLTLHKILDSRGLYSLAAQDILNAYYE